MAVHGRRQRVFCASLADVFDNAVDPQWRVDLLELIAKTPNLDWLLLTKRIGNAHAMLDAALDVMSHGLTEWAEVPWPNVWIGATIVNQEEADRDIPKLLAVPAARRFLSMEPLLGSVDLTGIYRPWGERGASAALLSRIHWVIVGGESGTGARPIHPDWARDLRDQCAGAGVPFLFKQWGEWAPGECSENTLTMRSVQVADLSLNGEWQYQNIGGNSEFHRDDEPTMYRAGKRAAGRRLDGVEHNAFPEAP
jgi:protein gp37